ncbi:cyclic nucleotide-binding domain-containing protein [Thermodesulfobacteriota bacterium]
MNNSVEKIERVLASPQTKEVLNPWIERDDAGIEDGPRDYLSGLGIEGDAALLLLSAFKSEMKYGYRPQLSKLSHIIRLAGKYKTKNPLYALIQEPIVMIKAAWIYDHAPAFLLKNRDDKGDYRDAVILEFAEHYEQDYLKHDPSLPLEKVSLHRDPYRLLTTSFWETKTWDPSDIILANAEKGMAGIELAFDFHPFNLTKLLPEEISLQKRRQIKKTAGKTKATLSIHSPIIGPYSPHPEPGKGKQAFLYPQRCMRVIKDAIRLAADIGAGTVVVHLMDPDDVSHLAELITFAADWGVIVSVENYCYTNKDLQADSFLRGLKKILKALPTAKVRRYFGVTFDVGHMNIEGTDPMIAAVQIGTWCRDNHVHFRMHATDNYGLLHVTPPHFSADIHANVCGRGIHNAMIIKILRSLGQQFDVVAEQIEPLSKRDIQTIDQAQRVHFDKSHSEILSRGKGIIDAIVNDPLIIKDSIGHEEAYLFIAGLEGAEALREYLLYRKIQEKKYLTADEAKKFTIQMMSMPQKIQVNIYQYLDELLAPIQRDMAEIKNQDMDIVCQNIAGGLFGALNNRQLNRLFSMEKTYRKGEEICRQSEPGQEIYFIKNGSAEIFLEDTAVASLHAGEIFGEISVLYDIPRTATVKARDDGTLIGIMDRNHFVNIIEHYDNDSKALIYRLYLFLPSRLRGLNEKYKIVVTNFIQLLNNPKKEEELFQKIERQMEEEQSFFRFHLTGADMNRLFSEETQCLRGEILFHEGDPADGAYIIKKGEVGIFTHGGGREIALAKLGKKDIFGEMALIDGGPRSADIRALSDTVLGFLPLSKYNRTINERSELSYRLMSSICLGLLSHIRRLDSIYSEVRALIPRKTGSSVPPSPP